MIYKGRNHLKVSYLLFSKIIMIFVNINSLDIIIIIMIKVSHTSF